MEQPTTWTWDEMHALPASTYDGDIHCVTTWSKLGMTFAGVSVDTCSTGATRADATHVRRVLVTPATPRTCPSPT